MSPVFKSPLSVLFAVLVFTILQTCKDESIPVPVDESLAYFPLQPGKYIEYRMDSVIFDVVSGKKTKDTTISYIREMVADTFTDLAGRKTFRLERFYKKGPTDPWTIHGVWTAQLTPNGFERTEDNLKFIKMIFPMVPDQEFNGLVYIDTEAPYYIADEPVTIYRQWGFQKVQKTNQKERVGLFDLDQVATVLLNNSRNVIEKRYAVEKYAKGIGMVYKEMQILDCQSCPGNTLDTEAERGFILRQIMTAHN
jgi:hypothetical protein